MDNEELRSGVSRRTAIKSVAAGSALVWAAPAISTIGASAFAQGSPHAGCGSDDDWTCGEPHVICGQSGQFDRCLCDFTVEGKPFCWEDTLCAGLPACDSSDDCPSGWGCFSSCCGQTCLPVCGTNRVNSLSDGGGTASGS